MDRQDNSDNARHIPTVEEIARAEAEAVAALQRGEVPAQAAAEAASKEAPQPQAEVPVSTEPAGFVPYVDDIPADAPQAGDADSGETKDADDDYTPGRMEQFIDSLPPKRWALYQSIGGALLGIATVLVLFIGSEETSSYRLIAAALLALLLPRYLEKSWQHKLNTARRAMVIAMVIALAVAFVAYGVQSGFRFFNR